LVERLTTSGFDRSDVNLTASASTSRRNRRRDRLEAVGPNGRLGPGKIANTVTNPPCHRISRVSAQGRS
jgi:hypothetical protein